MLTRTSATIILAGVLIAFYLAGNLARDPERMVSTFPFWIEILAVPLVIYPYLKGGHAADGPGALFRAGERVVRFAALAVGLAALAYGALVFPPRLFWLTIVSGLGSFLTVWLFGSLFALLCAWIIVKRHAQPGAAVEREA